MDKTLEIDVRTLFEFSGRPIPDAPPAASELEAMVREQFSFLPQPIQVQFRGWTGRIISKQESPAATSEAQRLGQKAGKRASAGEFDKAIAILKRALELEPSNYTLRRDLAMALVERGNPEEAKNHLIEVLHMQPNDVWGLVVLGNLFNKFEKDLDAAERFMRRALGIQPDDPWALNGLASILLEQSRHDDAAGVFARSIEVNPKFANPYLGLSMVHQTRGDAELAKQTLERLFAQADTQDARSVPVFEEARRLYAALMNDLAARRHDDIFKVVETMKQELVAASGYPIRVEAAETPGQTAAMIQMAWKHGLDHHLIRHRKHYQEPLLMHLIAHELQHLRLECDARQRGTNRILISTAENREKAVRSLGDDIARLQRQGFSETAITDVILELIHGIVRQVFNAPIDMMIETHLFHSVPALQPVQFLSLRVLAKEAEEACMHPEIQRRMPKKILRASAAMNDATAMFLDRLWGGVTQYSMPYRKLISHPLAAKLLAIYDNWIISLRGGGGTNWWTSGRKCWACPVGLLGKLMRGLTA